MDELNRRLGAHLRNLRQQRGWSLDIAAGHCQVSKAMLGQIERGESSPTVVTLWRIAAGFGVTFSALLGDVALEPEVSLWWLGKQTSPQVFADGVQVSCLLPYEPRLGYELLLVALPVGCCYYSVAHEAGAIEQILPISGSMSLWYQDEWHSLLPEQALRFAADCRHGYRNDGAEIARFHNLIYYAAGRQSNDEVVVS